MKYDKFYQNGGTYVIPAEIFNELIEENKDKLYQIIYAGLQFDVNKGVYDAFNNLIEENEKLNHYKLLYQKVKERNDKAIEYINSHYEDRSFDELHRDINKILKGNNETQ